MPTMIRAAVLFAPNEPMRIEELELAEPGPGEVQVRIFSTGLCHSDLHMIEGSQFQQFPVVLGHEAIGEVVKLGEGVTDFAIGDEVIPFLLPDCGVCPMCTSGRTNSCTAMMDRFFTRKSRLSLEGQPIHAMVGLGTFAEQIVVEADMLAKIRKGARPDHACCIGCGVTTGIGAALISAKVTAGSSVAVFGAGGVGLSVIQGARLAGAARIIAIDTNPAKENIARKLGATDFINAATSDDVVAEVVALTGMGADFAFECVGLPSLVVKALESTNPAWGLAMNVGILPMDATLTISPMVLQSGRRWSGSAMGGAKRQDVARYLDMYLDGQIVLDDLVSHRISLDDINRGFDMMRSGEAVRTVVMFDR